MTIPTRIPVVPPVPINTGQGADVLTLAEQAVRQKYASLAGQRTVDGYDVQAYLGAVVGPLGEHAGAHLQPYERGFVVVRGGRAWVVYGPVAAAWQRLGGPDGLLGLPSGDTTPAAGGGSTSAFDGGVVAGLPDAEAHELHGAILARWLELGGPAFGYPTSDETSILVNGAEVGRANWFADATGICWSAGTGAWEVTGAIATLWHKRFGAAGDLGLPTSGMHATPGADGGTYGEFVGGVIVDHPDGPYAGTFAITSLTLTLTGFHSTFDDIHVEAFVDVTDPATSWHDWIPSSSDYTSDPTPANPTPVQVPVVRASTSIAVSFDGLGQHEVGQDERLGFVKHTYDITNLWGTVGEDQDHPATDDINPSFGFGAVYAVKPAPVVDPSRPFRENYQWPFTNFGTPELGQDDYAQTYVDIAYDESTAGHPFDDYFYSHVYQHAATGGNCYGMSLSAVYAYLGRSVFTEPIYDNASLRYSPGMRSGGQPNQTDPSDERFAHDANIFHGYQFGLPAMDWYHDLGDALRSDPRAVFDQSKARHDAGEQVLLCFGIAKGTPQHEGHAVWAWSWEWNGDDGRIYVANPNQPWSRFPADSAPGNYIDIVPVSSTDRRYCWQISMDGVLWEGGPIDGTELYHVPFHVLASRPRRSTEGFLDAITNGATIVTGAGTDVSAAESGGLVSGQVVAAAGFGGVPGLVEVPLVSNAPSPIPRVPGRVPTQQLPPGRVPVRPRPPVAATDAHGRVFRLRRPLPRGLTAGSSGPLPTAQPLAPTSLVWTLTPQQGATATSMAIRSGRGSTVVEIDGAGGIDTLDAGPVLGAVPSVALTSSGARAARVQVSGRVDLPTPTTTVVDGLDLHAGTPAQVRMLDDGTGVTVVAAVDGECRITIARGGQQVQRAGVALVAGATTTLTPADPSAALAGQQLRLTQHAADGSVVRSELL